MEQWERALLESGIPAVETIKQSELESVIEECDTVPITARVVPDTPKYVMIVFMQGDDAAEMFDLLDAYGWDALIDRLSDWDCGRETEDAAVVNGDIYDDLPRYRGEQRVSSGEYTVIADWRYNYVALYRELPANWQPTI